MSDVTFGRRILAVCAGILASLVVVALLFPLNKGVLGGFCWVGFGVVSVMAQVLTDFGYLRLAPRADAVFSYSLSVLGGPFSLLRVGLRVFATAQRHSH